MPEKRRNSGELDLDENRDTVNNKSGIWNRRSTNANPVIGIAFVVNQDRFELGKVNLNSEAPD